MTNSDDRQQEQNNRSRALQAVIEEIDAIDVQPVASSLPTAQLLTDEEMADIAAAEQAALPARSLSQKELASRLALAKTTSDHIKEHDTRYNEIGRAMRKVDAHRKAEGQDDYNRRRREEYAKEKGRPVRAYAVPDSEAKRKARNKAKNTPRRKKLDAMTEAERKAYNAAEAERKRNAREAKKLAAKKV